ncbi:MAG: hypothetical protein ACHQVS_00735 [Candidatus Babeliales bacterium]
MNEVITCSFCHKEKTEEPPRPKNTLRMRRYPRFNECKECCKGVIFYRGKMRNFKRKLKLAFKNYQEAMKKSYELFSKALATELDKPFSGRRIIQPEPIYRSEARRDPVVRMRRYSNVGEE